MSCPYYPGGGKFPDITLFLAVFEIYMMVAKIVKILNFSEDLIVLTTKGSKIYLKSLYLFLR